MISFFTKFKNVILIAIIVCFLGSLGYVGAGALSAEYGPRAAIATVGDEKISYQAYDRVLKNAYQNLQSQESEEAEELAREQIKKEVLQSLISQSALKQAALALGLGVSDMEIAYEIKNSPLFSATGSFNKDTYLWIIRNRLGMNAAEFEEEMKNSKLSQKYQEILIFAAKASPQEETFLNSVLFKGQAAQEGQIMLLKAQTLANNFIHDFNQRNMITFTKLAPDYQEKNTED